MKSQDGKERQRKRITYKETERVVTMALWMSKLTTHRSWSD